MKLVYIVNARLPTEKAHGYQICKMCEAFALKNIETILLHPFRRQSDAKLKNSDIFNYYGINHNFKVIQLHNLDVVPLSLFVPPKLFTPLFFSHGLIWALYATFKAKKLNADIYFTRNSEIAFWLSKLHLPFIYEVHSIPEKAQKRLLAKIKKSPSLILIIAVTSFIKNELIKIGFASEKIIVLGDAVDLSLFENLPNKEQCRSRIALPLNRHIIGYVGRFHTLEMEKGIPEAIEAMSYINSRNSMHSEEFLLVFLGGPMGSVPKYINYARQLGLHDHQLMFVDRVPNWEVPFWIKSYDLAIAPFPFTKHYAFFMSPLKIFEYMASEVPIISTELPSIKEIIKHNENAWLVPPNDPKALAEAILYLIYNSAVAKRIAAKAKCDVLEYTWENRVLKILSFIKKKD